MENITLSCSFGMIYQKNLNQSERSQLDYPRPATICYAGREERWNRQTDNSDEKVFLIDGAIKESGSSNGIFFSHCLDDEVRRLNIKGYEPFK